MRRASGADQARQVGEPGLVEGPDAVARLGLGPALSGAEARVVLERATIAAALDDAKAPDVVASAPGLRVPAAASCAPVRVARCRAYGIADAVSRRWFTPSASRFSASFIATNPARVAPSIEGLKRGTSMPV